MNPSIEGNSRPAVLINLPYAAGAVPEAVARRLDLSPEEWRLEHWRLIDSHLAAIVKKAAVFERATEQKECPVIVYPYSPLVADPWGLWASELGDRHAPGPALAARTTAGKALTAWSPRDRELILGRTVEPFYRQIEEAAEKLLAASPLVLVVTLRSFSPDPLPFEKNQRRPRPQVCVSPQAGLTPRGLADLAGGVFRTVHWWAELGWPQDRGAALPPRLAGHPRVRALGLSLRRDLYLDERTGRPKPAAESVARVLRTVFNNFDQELARVARRRLERILKPKESPIIKAAGK